ncbi:MAG: response regulator [Methyloprofundus sp.]|nr:response regulator [Methyloprofundus sp.]
MRLNKRKFKTHALVAVLFLGLALGLTGLMYGYWSLVIQPRLYLEAQSHTKILAEAQARMIANTLSTQSSVNQASFDELSDQALIFIDPTLQQAYFLGISLELDDEVLTLNSDIVTLSAGDMQCTHCFFVTTAMYSLDSYELLGIVNFAVNDVFYQKLKHDIQQILLLEGTIALAALFIVWIAITFFIRRLNYEIKARQKISKELSLAKDSAEQASQTKSDFLANMSHEIRTPLNAIIGMNYILLRSSLDSRQQDLLKKSDSSAKILLSLINDLLDFSKIEAAKLELEKVPFKMDDVLDSLAEMVMTKAGEKGIDIMYLNSREIPHSLIGDPLRLGQILLNLMNNALKFTQQGEILLSIELLESTGQDVYLQFTIKDTGIGIQPEDINKLFQSFTQADNSTTRKFGGTGLGLSICKQLVELMQGEISVSSVYGQGSSFIFTAQFGVEACPSPLFYTFPEVIHKTHVLVIDDNPLAQSIFQYMLECFGFKVLTAGSAPEGIELLKHHAAQQQPIKLVLMDWNMPDMDGMQASLLIKKQLGLDPIPAIIMVTAYSEGFNSAGKAESWDDYLVKPISQSVLYNAIIKLFSVQTSLPESKHTDTITPSLHTKHVLLAEDNLTNQEVACALLSERNIQVSIANNGREALEILASQDFDLIFMDLQMPEMDGMEATRLIRLNKAYQKIPIVAMTAHAMRGDREKCLAAQMDDYITKPLDIDKFFALLDKWLINKQEDNQVNEQNSPAKSTEVLNLPDLASIDITKALVRMRGKQELLIRLLLNFKKQKIDIADKIAQAMQANDIETAKALVHNLKGESGTLEASAVFLASKTLEQALLQQSSQQHEAFLALEHALNRLLKDIDLLEKITHQDTLPPETSDTLINMAGLSLELNELSSLLRNNNLRAKKLAKVISPQLDHSKYAADWGTLLQGLAELDFEAAHITLQKLAEKLTIKLQIEDKDDD